MQRRATICNRPRKPTSFGEDIEPDISGNADSLETTRVFSARRKSLNRFRGRERAAPRRPQSKVFVAVAQTLSLFSLTVKKKGGECAGEGHKSLGPFTGPAVCRSPRGIFIGAATPRKDCMRSETTEEWLGRVSKDENGVIHPKEVIPYESNPTTLTASRLREMLCPDNQPDARKNI
jgi:hypothetical protein